MNKNEFKKVYDNGIKSYGRYITVYHLSIKNGHSNLGVSINKRVGIACRRNYFKRVFREIFRKNKIYFNNKYHIVINVKTAIKDKKYGEIEKDVVTLFRKTGILNI